MAGLTRGAGVGAGPGTSLAPLGSSPTGAGVALGVLALGVAVGAVAGAIEAEPAEVVEQREATLRAVVSGLSAQARLGEAVAARARDEAGRDVTLVGAAAAPAHVSTALEVTIEDIALRAGAAHGGSLWPLQMVLHVRTRLIAAPTGATLYDLTLTYVGRRTVTLGEWVEDGARALRDELDAAYGPLAERIVDEVFLVYRPARTAR